MSDKKLIKLYKIFYLGKCETQLDYSVDDYTDFAEPDYILATMRVPYVDNAIMPMFKEWYQTEAEAIADLEKMLPVRETQYVIIPVYKMVKDW